MSASVVQISALRWSRSERAVVDGVDLAVAAGEVVALVGPSGAGKTALLHLLAGITQPDSGTIAFAFTSSRSPGWPDVALVPQSIALIDELTVVENITFADRAARRGQHDGNDELLAALGLERLSDRLVDEISVGERQRTMVARALARSATLVLADEPTAHQDEHHAEAVLSALRDAARDGRACVIATRDPAIVIGVADRIVTVSDGRVR
jgi:ABC-type lipoprotein export system ATPase subunit